MTTLIWKLFPLPQPSPDLWEQEPSSSTWYLPWGGWDIHWVLMTTSDWQAVIIPWEWGNVQTHWKHDHVSRWHQSPLTTDSSQPCRQWTIEGSRALAVLCNSHCFFLSLPEENKRWMPDSQRHMRWHNCPSLSITAELGQLNKYLKRFLPGTWVSSRDAAVSSKNVVFLNKLDRLLWRC